MMTNVLANTTAVGNVSNFSYLLWYLITAPPFILPTKPSYPEVFAVAGDRAQLPCSVSLEDPENPASLVLWYRGESKTPFHTADLRNGSLQAARHYCAPEYADRSGFELLPALLRLQPVLAADAGLYTCRVQFKKSPTVTNMVRLHVIIPPMSIMILDEEGTEVSGLIGPYNEMHNLTLTCLAVGGSPSPIVSWWNDSTLVDDEYSTFPNETVNQLILHLARNYYHVKLTCLASNTNLTVPLSSSVTFDMNLKPLSVNITTPQTPLYAGWATEVSCESRGSKPPAALTWWMDGEKMAPRNETVSDGATVSTLHFTPGSRDNGKVLSCRADNLQLQDSGIEHQWRVNVFYLPRLHLVYGASIRPENVVEGTDVYFDCAVDSNPDPPEVAWFFGRQPLFSEPSAGVIISNQSLALRKVNRTQSGLYQCSAANDVGQGWSEPLLLQVKYSPTCKDTTAKMVLLPSEEITTLECTVESYPEVETFYWKLDSKTTSTPTRSSAVNYISYSSSHGYGDVMCWGVNEMGTQVEPCRFRVIKKDERTALKDCGVKRHADSILEVSCGGVTEPSPEQCFYLEVYGTSPSALLANLSSGARPAFVLRGAPFRSELYLRMYAAGPDGRSEAVMFLAGTSASNASEFHVQKPAERSPGLAMTSLLIIVIAVFVLLLVIGCFVAIATRYYLRDKNARQNQIVRNRTENSSSKELNEDASGCPDVVPDAQQIRESIRKKNSQKEIIELDQFSSQQDEECGKVVFV